MSLALGVLLVFGCRDATQAVEPENRSDPGELPRQLTFSAENDRAPAWGPGGDSLWYSVRAIPPFPELSGILLSVSTEGGEAVPLMPELQLVGVKAAPVARTEFEWLAAPVPNPGGDRVAYVELTFVWPRELCRFVTRVQCTPPTDPTVPRLRDATIRIRSLDRSRSVREEPAAPVSFESRRIIPPPPFTSPPPQGLWGVTHHPFQQLFAQEGSAIFRPSWSPDGEAVVFSDGLRLLLWVG